MIHQRLDPFTIRQIREMLQSDLRNATSQADLTQRLNAKGYGLRPSANGTMLTAEPQGLPLFPYTAPAQ
ncbi:hypothetical protein [Amylibacter sp. IMCC11727]|uniref:hypothetical protein n=1 Tax=Amylibacter sp. IMCC11727 TaxID=3039851 RepID=UPI00244E39B4|nr:hypothetical protein [Amylibacter sp. IMCC11727]WGI21281.1 hypothetical protein QBD29_14350 [Amylibacter sp. IMCC11727]